MKVIIFAGGLGTRLGTLTDVMPKPMARIGGRPMIWHIMKLYSHFGFNDFVLCLGYKQEVIKEYFYNYDLWSNDFKISLSDKDIEILSPHDERDWKITLVDTGLNTERGARLKMIEKYMDDGLNMMTYGDGLADIDLNKLIRFHKKHKKTLTITGVYPPSRFGEISEKSSRIISFDEKPQVKSGLINGGFCVFDKRLLKNLTTDEKCDLEREVFEKLAKRGEAMVYKHKNNWACVDTEKDLRYLNEIWSEGKAFWKLWK